MRRAVIGVDVGGTKMAGAVVDLNGNMLYRNTIASHGKQKPLTTLVELIQHLAGWAEETFQVVGVGLGVPGVVHSDGNTVSVCPGLNWEHVPIRYLVQKEVGLPVWLENDLNVITLGESWQGSLRGVGNGICLAIGTGLGAGIQINGDIYRGAHGASGEVGLWSLLGSDYRGTLESYVAGPGILRQAVSSQPLNSHFAYSSAEDVFVAATQGDKNAQIVVSKTTTLLGKAIANMALFLDVQRIVISGGVAQVGEHLLAPVRSVVEEMVPFAPEIVRSALGLDAGILGAVYGFLKYEGLGGCYRDSMFGVKLQTYPNKN